MLPGQFASGPLWGGSGIEVFVGVVTYFRAACVGLVEGLTEILQDQYLQHFMYLSLRKVGQHRSLSILTREHKAARCISLGSWWTQRLCYKENSRYALTPGIGSCRAQHAIPQSNRVGAIEVSFVPMARCFPLFSESRRLSRPLLCRSDIMKAPFESPQASVCFLSVFAPRCMVYCR